MDALMIVHQLQRLAAEPRPSPAVKAKIPRMAVGICYFLEHPDPGVQHQAAGALRLLLEQHRQLLLQSPELHEMRSALQQHANNSDVVVSECCTASLTLLQQDAVQQRQPEPSDEQQRQAATETGEETLESLDLFSVVLGLRGLLRCPSNRSLITFKREPQGRQQQAQDQHGKRMLELLQRDLQLRLVRVWGVSSATVTLNTTNLLQQAEALCSHSAVATEEQKQSSEEGDGVAVVSIRLSRRAQRLQQQLRELRAAVGPLTLLLNSALLQKAQPKDIEVPKAALWNACTATGTGSAAARATSPPVQQQQDDSGYLDEELRGNWEGTGESQKNAEVAAGSSRNNGFSFFSANSALFAQSRFMGGMITPTENSAEMSAKLKAEKERKAALRAQPQGGIIDRLLGRLGSGAGLL
ncbi:uncharacterized protein LOC34621901 [Cyclospora cayetanensis]|uniref:Uncharacterized protein LOC34621901 n=2 Tax=Cyclospora cayetanensis TaxID=88456 RepID=A0A6P5WDR2_9EIME|nr:uncharacterized protein LOC34621901 [Cyclospora cayetanensis]OEH78131.1 hypothetical protein cyc_05565 [Cyclospora cayetanensis]